MLEWLLWILTTTGLFWAAPQRLRFAVLSSVTLAFLMLKDPMSAVVLLALTIVTWLATRTSVVSGQRSILAIVPIIVTLGFFKIWSAASGDDLLTDTLIPLGLSYYALRCIHFVLERYKGSVVAQGFPELLNYLFFLPTIYVGPIHRFPEFDRDVRRHRWDADLFSEGLERILYGYVKITFLANYLVSQAYHDWVTSLGLEHAALILYADMLRISFNLYFQFSGYSDVAIGFARLLGFRVMENFDKPFLQSNIADFWKSWHISLTGWCREYVYVGVIGLTRNPSLAVLATLLAIALWHEVSWRYFVWGCYHGLGVIVWQRWEKLWRTRRGEMPLWLSRIATVFSVLLTLHFVCLGFLLVRQPDLTTMLKAAQTLLLFWI